MSYRTVEVSIPRKQATWFKRRRAFPASVQVNQKTAIFAGTTFELRPLADGFTAVVKPGGCLPLGEFSADTIRHTISDNAAKDVRVLRAAVLDVDYLVPIALELPDGRMVHPGRCHRRLPYLAVKKHTRVHHEDDRCATCGEAFE